MLDVVVTTVDCEDTDPTDVEVNIESDVDIAETIVPEFKDKVVESGDTEATATVGVGGVVASSIVLL